MIKQANDKKGQVITFYSYKGGTGRSMALANTACLLLRDGHRVLMIDWDMEAPGLPKYFRPYLPTSKNQLGLIDFMEMADKQLPEMEYDAEDEAALQKVFGKIGDYLTPVRNIPEAKGELFLLKSGDEHAENYPLQISHFDWEKFFYKIRGFFTHFARYLAQEFDYVLIDSRTGHTDTGGICTMMMPEKLVLVFTPNRQSYDGIANLARKATNYRRRSDDMRPLVIYPLPSRIELGEEDLRQEFLANYRDDFRALLQEVYNVPDLNFDNYMENIQIRHSSKFAYQERLAVLEERIWDKDSLSRVYRNFTDLLESKEMFWKVVLERYPPSPNYASRWRISPKTLLTSVLTFAIITFVVVWYDNENKKQQEIKSASPKPYLKPVSQDMFAVFLEAFGNEAEANRMKVLLKEKITVIQMGKSIYWACILANSEEEAESIRREVGTQYGKIKPYLINLRDNCQGLERRGEKLVCGEK